MAEEWRVCEEFPDYEVSDWGRVRNKDTGEVLKPRIKLSGYLEYGLFKDKKEYYRLGHRLVGKAFLPNDSKKRTIDHLDENKTNNALTNLQWATDSENNTKKTIRIGKTGFRGVKKDGVGFQAYLGYTYLGYFPTAEEAYEMRQAVGRGLFGEFFRN